MKIVIFSIIFSIAIAAPSKRLPRSFHNSFSDRRPNAFSNFAGSFSNAVTSKDHYAPKSSGSTNSFSAQASSHNFGGQTFTGAATNTQTGTIVSGSPYQQRQDIASAQTGVLGHGGFGYGASSNVLAQTAHAGGYNYAGANSFTGGYGGSHDGHSGSVANAAAQSAVAGGVGAHGGGVSATAGSGTFGGGHGYSGSIANAAVQSRDFGKYGNSGGNYRDSGRNHNRFDDRGRDTIVAKANGQFKDIMAGGNGGYASGSYRGHNTGGISFGQNHYVGQAGTVNSGFSADDKLFNEYLARRNEGQVINGHRASVKSSGNYEHKTEDQQKGEAYLVAESNVHQRFHPTTTVSPRQHFPCNTLRPHARIDGIAEESHKFHLNHGMGGIKNNKFIGHAKNVHASESNIYRQEDSLSRHEEEVSGSQGASYNGQENLKEIAGNRVENVTKVLQGDSGYHDVQKSGFLDRHEKTDVVKSESAGGQKQEASFGHDSVYAPSFKKFEEAEQNGGIVGNTQIGTFRNVNAQSVVSDDHQIGAVRIIGNHDQNIAASNIAEQNLGKAEQTGKIANGASSYTNQQKHIFANNHNFHQNAAATATFSANGANNRNTNSNIQSQIYGNHGLAGTNTAHSNNLAGAASSVHETQPSGNFHGQNVALVNAAKSGNFGVSFGSQGVTGGVANSNNLGHNTAAASSLHQSESSGNYHGQNVVVANEATQTGNFGAHSVAANSANFNNLGVGGGVANAIVHSSNVGHSAGAVSSVLQQSDSSGNYHGQNVAVANAAVQIGSLGGSRSEQAGSFGHGNVAQASNQNHLVSASEANSRFMDHGFGGKL